MKRLACIVGLIIAMVTAPGLSVGAVAQDNPPLLDSPVSYVGTDGLELGTVTVTDVHDPYLGFPESRPPDPGFKYVLVNVTFEGSDEGGFDVLNYLIYVHDTTGGLWERGFPAVADDYPQPELASLTVPPGSRVGGYVGYIIPDSVQVDSVFFAPEDGVFLTIADLLPNASPAVGTAVSMTNGAEGSEALGTVKSVDDPYKGFDTDRPPVAGARFVMVVVSFENTGTGVFDVEPSGVLLRDQDGHLWARADVTPAKKPKLPVLQSVDLAAGNLISGRLAYQVPKDAVLEGLYFQGAGHFFQIADLDGPDEPGTGQTGAVTCDVLTAWWAEVSPLMQRLFALPYFESDAAPMDLAASQAVLAELESIRAAQLAISPAEGLVDIHRHMLGAFLLYEQSARTQVASQEAEDPSLLFGSGEAFEAAQLVLADTIAALTPLGYDDCISE